MLISNVAVYVMNVEIIQIYMLHRPAVFCNSGYAGAIHPLIICARRLTAGFRHAAESSLKIIKIIRYVCNLQIADFHKIYVVEQNCRRYVAHAPVLVIVQVSVIILIPYALSVRINHRLFRPGSIAADSDRRILGAMHVFQMNIPVVKYRPLFQKYGISWKKLQIKQHIQRFPRLSFRCSGISIVSIDTAYIIRRSRRFPLRRLCLDSRQKIRVRSDDSQHA